MKPRRRRIAATLVLVAMGILLWGKAEAFFVDSKKTLGVTGKVQTRLSMRLQDSEGWTSPIDISVGNIVQWRNLALLEVNHDLKDLTKSLDILYPLKALKIRSKYRMVGRFLYEGIYDVGPQAFQDVKDGDKENITSFTQQYELWEGYIDFSRGPAFVRIGRQNLAWGETDLFRLLDGINPLDNTFGGPIEDLDDRRIPLWMLRGNYNFGDLGPLSSITLEGFWVPGSWDVHVAPFAPFSTAYSAPLPEPFFPFVVVNTPAKEMSNSRWGVRLMGMIAAKVNVSIAHYKSFPDNPALRSVAVREIPVLIDLNDLRLEASYHDVQVTGASVSFWEPNTDVIVRSEVGYFWEEPVFIPEENMGTFFGPTLPLPPPLLDLATVILGVDPRDLGLDGLPVNPQSGTIPKKNILRFVLGLDKQIWIRPLNKSSMFFCSFQYFLTWVPDYDDRMRLPAPIYPALLLDFPKVKETEHIFTTVIVGSYRKGTLTPQLAFAYDVRGAFLVQPSVTYIWEPFRFMLQYTAFAGNYTAFGVFRDRDQITLAVSYLLN